MVQGIGGGGLARNAIEAALQGVRQNARKIEEEVAQSLARPLAGDGGTPAAEIDFAGGLGRALAEGVRETDAMVRAGERAPADLLQGGIADLGELAARLKTSELTFQFSLEVRNKLIEAYREVMRMSV